MTRSPSSSRLSGGKTKVAIDNDVLLELKSHSEILSQIADALRTQGKVLADVSQGLTLVLERQSAGGRAAPTLSPGREPVSWTLLLAVLAGIVGLFTVVIGVTVAAVSTQGADLGNMRFAINQWTDQHDARVLPMNSEQSMAIAQNCDTSRQLWSKTFPDILPPLCQTPARPGGANIR